MVLRGPPSSEPPCVSEGLQGFGRLGHPLGPGGSHGALRRKVRTFSARSRVRDPARGDFRSHAVAVLEPAEVVPERSGVGQQGASAKHGEKQLVRAGP